ncbi:hypothetical protein ACOSQ2_004329 [Xanthoceras sorbifolium]
MKPPDKTAPAYPRLQETQLPQATQNQPNQTTLVSEPSITTTPKQQIHLQSGPSITTTPAAPKFNSSTVLRTLELSSIQTHMTRRGDRGGLITTEPLQHQIHAPSNTNVPDPSPPNNPSQLTREATSSSRSPPI